MLDSVDMPRPLFAIEDADTYSIFQRSSVSSIGQGNATLVRASVHPQLKRIGELGGGGKGEGNFHFQHLTREKCPCFLSHTSCLTNYALQDVDIIYAYLHGMETLCNLREAALRSICKSVRHEFHDANDILYWSVLQSC